MEIYCKNIWNELLLLIICICAFILNPIPLLSNGNNNYFKNPKAILNEITKRDACIVISELYNEEIKWNFVLHQIASGKIIWLKVAVALRSCSDAGSSEMLDLSVGEALEIAPANVFRIALSEFNLENICGSPDVDDPRYNSYKKSMQAITRRIEQISKISDLKLQAVCEKSIKLLEKSKKHVKRYFYKPMDNE